MTSLSATSVSFSAGAKTIIRDVSLETGSGEMTAIVGPNGAGKSILMEMLAGLLKTASGDVRVGGEPVDQIPVDQLARLRSYLTPDLIRTIRFTVREVVDMGRHPWTSRSDLDPSPTERALEAMNLEHMAEPGFRHIVHWRGETHSDRSRPCTKRGDHALGRANERARHRAQRGSAGFSTTFRPFWCCRRCCDA